MLLLVTDELLPLILIPKISQTCQKTNRALHTSISKWLNSRFLVLIVKAIIKRTMKINNTPNNTN